MCLFRREIDYRYKCQRNLGEFYAALREAAKRQLATELDLPSVGLEDVDGRLYRVQNVVIVKVVQFEMLLR